MILYNLLYIEHLRFREIAEMCEVRGAGEKISEPYSLYGDEIFWDPQQRNLPVLQLLSRADLLDVISPFIPEHFHKIPSDKRDAGQEYECKDDDRAICAQ